MSSTVILDTILLQDTTGIYSFEMVDKDGDAIIKECVGFYCNPLVSGQICEFLESSNGDIPKKRNEGIE